MSIKQSFCYPLFLNEGQDLADLFQQAAQIGYKATEFWHRDENSEKVIADAHQAGLVVASMCAHQSLTDGLNNPDSHDRIEAEIIASIDLAAKHQIPGLICFSGNRQEGQSDYEGMVQCAKGLRRVIAYAEKHAINLNMELLNSRVDHPGYLCDHTDWGVAMCEMVNSPRMKLLYDIYHMQIMEGDLIRTIEKSIRYIGHFHTAGNPGRHDTDDTQELNYRGICKAISKMDFDLYLGHEFMTTGDRTAALRYAFEQCDQ